jgi:hypothetical protein
MQELLELLEMFVRDETFSKRPLNRIEMLKALHLKLEREAEEKLVRDSTPKAYVEVIEVIGVISVDVVRF